MKVLTKDVIELVGRLRKFYDFYYALKEATYIPLNLNTKMNDTVEIVQVDKAEWERWKNIKILIDNFEVPH